MKVIYILYALLHASSPLSHAVVYVWTGREKKKFDCEQCTCGSCKIWRRCMVDRKSGNLCFISRKKGSWRESLALYRFESNKKSTLIFGSDGCKKVRSEFAPCSVHLHFVGFFELFLFFVTFVTMLTLDSCTILSWLCFCLRTRYSLLSVRMTCVLDVRSCSAHLTPSQLYLSLNCI